MVKYIKIDRWPPLNLGPLTSALSRLPSWVPARWVGRDVREREKWKGSEDKEWRNGTQPHLGRNLRHCAHLIFVVTTITVSGG